MSKKRSWSLSSKCKLNKELEDYKQHKKDKRQGGLGYIVEKVIKVRSKKKFPCKRLKGDHNFKLKKIDKYSFFDGYADIYECEACGKIKYDLHIKKL